MANRQELVEKLPGYFKGFEEEKAYFEAIETIQDYIPQRRWMIAQEVDFS